jgi:hypothetical protein
VLCDVLTMCVQDLVRRLLTYSPTLRPTVAEALADPYLLLSTSAMLPPAARKPTQK